MLVLASSMQAFFRDALDSALRTSSIKVTDEAQVYLVHLLNEFSRSEKAFAGVDQGQTINLASLLERAIAADDYEAIRIYRHLGDSSLYLLSFFKDSKVTRRISETYYKDMGANAYSCASDLSRAYAAHSAAIFGELSERFSDLVMVLENITKFCNSSDRGLI